MKYSDDEEYEVRKKPSDTSIRFDSSLKKFDKYEIPEYKSISQSNKSANSQYISSRDAILSHKDKYTTSLNKKELSDPLEHSRIRTVDDFLHHGIHSSRSTTNLPELRSNNFIDRTSSLKQREKQIYTNGVSYLNGSLNDLKPIPKKSSYTNHKQLNDDNSDEDMDTSDPYLANSSNFEKKKFSSRKFFDGNASIVSNSSMQALLKTQELRDRANLSGSYCTTTGLLSKEELERIYPDRKIQIFIGTWNQGEAKNIECNLKDFLLPNCIDSMPDIYVIGTQESNADRLARIEWSLMIQKILGHHFVLFHESSHGALHTVYFFRRHLIWYTSIVEDENVTTRLGPSSIKTKGANAICFILFGSTFLFINSHFKANEGKSEDRIEDFKKIVETLNLPKTLIIKDYSDQGGDATARFDFTFWFGDLNSRLKIERKTVEKHLKTIDNEKHAYEEFLLSHDELRNVMNEDRAFSQFHEGKLRFPPTYKYDIGNDHFDTSKKERVPSYTDRILYRFRKENTTSCILYDSVQSIKISDHRPVFGVFTVVLRPGLDGMPLSGGQYNRDIWIQGYERQLKNSETLNSNQSSSICSLM